MRREDPVGAAHPGARPGALVWATAVLAPPAVAGILVTSRGHLSSADDALVLMVVTVAVASFGHRLAAAVAAVVSAASFDFLLTVPYASFRIRRQADLTTEVLFIVVGLLVGNLAARGRRHHRDATEGRGELARIHQLAERIAGGEGPDFVLIAVASELRDLLDLQDCRFVWEPPSGRGAWIDPDGTVRLNPLRWPSSLGLPTRRVELPVRGGGRTLGTFLLTPTPATPVSRQRCLVAVALVDQLGSVLAARPTD